MQSFDGDGSDQRIQHKSALNATAEFSKEFSHPVGLSLWAMYQGIVVILLLNILIAMMNNTYMRIWANVDTEWKFAKTHFQVLLTTSAKKSIKNTNFEQTYIHTGAVLGIKSYYTTALQVFLLLLTIFTTFY